MIDHDEKQCETLFHSENCYYVVGVLNEGASNLSYKLLAQHNQNNHVILQEKAQKIDSVDLLKYKYYKFTIIPSAIE